MTEDDFFARLVGLPGDIVESIGRRISKANAKNETSKRQTEAQLGTPLADTLSALSGGGDASFFPMLGYVDEFGGPVRHLFGYGNRRVNGLYSPALDAMSAPNRQTLIHEMGHRRDARTGHMLRSLISQDKRFVVPESEPTSQEEKRARKKVDDYYQTNQVEGYAQAFQAAVNILQQTSKRAPSTREAYANWLARVEAMRPGTGSLVDELLREPTYANHPLQAFYRGQDK